MAKRGRKRRDEGGEGREGNGGQTRDEPHEPHYLGQSSPTTPHLTVSTYIDVDSPSKAYSNGHSQAVIVPCATLRVAKRVKEDENKNPVDNNVATPVDGTSPGTKDVLTPVLPQAQNSAAGHSRYSLRHGRLLPKRASLRIATRVKKDEMFINSAVECEDGSCPVTEYVPTAEKSTSQLPPQCQILKESNPELTGNVPTPENSTLQLPPQVQILKESNPELTGNVPTPGNFTLQLPPQCVEECNPELTGNVPTPENSTLQLPPQGQSLEESDPEPHLEQLNSTIAIFVPAVSAVAASVVNTSDPRTLKEAEIQPPTYTENTLHENGDSPSRNSGLLARSLSFNLSEMIALMDDGSSSQSEVDYHGNDHPLVTVEGYRVKTEYAPTLRLVLSKHGDIGANSFMESVQSRSYFLELICHVIKDLEISKFAEVSIGDLECMRTIVKDAENVRIDANWLGKRLDDIIEAKQIVKESATLKKTRNKTEEVKKELNALREKVRLTEENLAAMEAEAANIPRKLLEVKEKVKCFHQRSLVEGLL